MPCLVATDDDNKRGKPESAPPSRTVLPGPTTPRRPRTPVPPSPRSPFSQRTPVPPSSRLPPTRRPSSMMRLPAIDFDVVNAARRILEGSLGLVPGEKVFLLLDRERAELGPALVETARSAGARCEMLVLEDIEPRPVHTLPEAVRAAVGDAQATVMLIGFQDGEQPMRLEFLELVRDLELRHAHMVGVTRRSMIAGFSVDPSRILDMTRVVRTRLRPDSALKLRTGAGSDMSVTLTPAHRWAEHVGVIRPGRWENLPSGELMTSPATVDGVFVCDASMGGHFGAAAGLMASTPVRLAIEASVVRSVSCPDRGLQREVEAFLRRELYADHVGTVVLGTNVGILSPVGELICDQNLPGLHIGLGTTFPEMTGAPFTTRSQLSLTCAYSDVDLDGAPLLRSGRYLI